jgi:tetratricopeptide (TPR) repeat protein
VKTLAALLVVILASGTALAQDAATQQLLADADRHYDLGEYDRAARDFDRAIGGKPRDVPPAAYAKRATIFLIQRKHAEGMTWISTVAERAWPADDAILEQKAIIASRLPDRRKDAAALAEGLVARKPNLYTLQILLGDYFYQAGSGGAAKTVSHYRSYLDHRPAVLATQDPLVRVKLGYAYLHLGKYSESEREFDVALKGADSSVAANARKGQCAAFAGQKRWDTALTVCEKVIRDGKALRGDSSPHYNIGLAYLARDRFEDALKAANQYILERPKDAKGFLLRGAVYFRQGKLSEAEAQFLNAEGLSPSDPQVARELGRVYLKQKLPGKAIEKLTRALGANATDVETIASLAEAYLADGQGRNAALQAERALKIPAPPTEAAARNSRLLSLAGEGHYLAGELPEARASLESALDLARAAVGGVDSRTRGLLVDTINRQAAASFKADDTAAAEKLLLEAYAVDKDSTRTSYNLGLLAVERGQYPEAIRYLSVRLARTPNDLVTNRVIARAYVGAGDNAKAGQHYAVAEREAKSVRNRQMLAEIYTEWAPLLVAAGDVGGAVDRLEQGAELAKGLPFESDTRRNLALARFRQGYDLLRRGRGTEAIPALEASLKDPKLLEGDEPQVFGFALGLAYLDAGQLQRAAALFGAVKKGQKIAWLKPPYDVIGPELLVGYTLYREGNAASRTRAAAIFDRLAKAGGGAKLRELLASTYELLAVEQWGRDARREAEASLRKAQQATTDPRRSLQHNLAVLDMEKSAGSRALLERLGDRVPEALVNLGILAERDGDARKAYDLWMTARSRGLRSTRLDEWIETKKRVHGFTP